MALSQTVTLSHGREFGGSNPGVRLDDSADPVELDSGFFTVPDADSEVTGAFVKATFRARTAWIHLNQDLWFTPTGGSRTDLAIDLYSPTTDKWCRLAFSAYATRSSRSDNLAQVSFNLTTPVPTNVAGRSYQSLNDWATAVEAESPHDVDITFMSASSQAWRAPAPDTVDGTFLGGTKVSEAFLGTKTVSAAFLGTKQVFGAPMTPSGMAPGVPTGLTLTAGDAQVVASWTAVTATPAATYRLRYRTGTGAWTEVPTSALMATVSSLTNGTTYEFQVRAENSAGNSAYSASVSVTPVGLPTTWISLHSDNGAPQGIWSDGTTVWVVDFSDRKLYAYTLATGARDTTKEFDLTGIQQPYGPWSDGTTVWVSDYQADRLLAYTISTGVRDSAKEFGLAERTVFDEGNNDPRGCWSDGTTMWVVDITEDIVYAYTLATGARVSAKQFGLAESNIVLNSSPQGIWGDGTTMWVVDFTDDKLYAYTLATGARDSAKEFDLNSLNSVPRGCWSDGTTMWVADSTDLRLYPYRLSDGRPLFPTS